MTAIFSFSDYVSDSSIATGDRATNLPGNNIGNRTVQKVWRSGSSTSTYFTVDFGSAVSIELLALFGCTLASTDTVRHQLSAVSAGAGEVLDTGAIACGVEDGYGAHIHLLDAAVSARYWRCDIVATSRADVGYFDIGRAWAGPVWSPDIGIAIGWGTQIVDLSESERSPYSGVFFPGSGAKYRKLNVTFDSLSDDERLDIEAFDMLIGKTGQLVFIPDAAGNFAKSAILGHIADSAPTTQPNDVARFNRSFSIEEDK